MAVDRVDSGEMLPAGPDPDSGEWNDDPGDRAVRQLPRRDVAGWPLLAVTVLREGSDQEGQHRFQNGFWREVRAGTSPRIRGWWTSCGAIEDDFERSYWPLEIADGFALHGRAPRSPRTWFAFEPSAGAVGLAMAYVDLGDGVSTFFWVASNSLFEGLRARERRCIGVIERHPGCTRRFIADATGELPGDLTRCLRSLVKRGFVNASEPTIGKRTRFWLGDDVCIPTEAGQAMFEKKKTGFLSWAAGTAASARW